MIETRLCSGDREILRRRECKGCQTRVVTREFVVSEGSLWVQMRGLEIGRSEAGGRR